MEADDADHERRHLVDAFAAEVDVVEAAVEFDGHFEQHEPDHGEVEDLVEDTAEVGELGDGVPVDEGAEEVGHHLDLVTEHEEDRLEEGQPAEHRQDLADYFGLFSRWGHSVQNLNSIFKY